MDFEFTEDQRLFVAALDRWAADHIEVPVDGRAVSYLRSDGLAEELIAQGYYDVVQQDELGVLGAVLLIEAVGRTPWPIEVAASALLAPMLELTGLERPLAIFNLADQPVVRFLSPHGSALVDAGDHVRRLRCDERIEAVDTRYAYPIGRFVGDVLAASERIDGIDVDEFRSLRRIALAAEALAAMRAALNLTVDHVKSRVQFGRAIGSFQAVQHRLAECSVVLHGVQLLLYRAAVEGPLYAKDAAIVAHDAVKRVLYETNQFHGAIGLTLEYPLHLWTYRLRLLQFELAQLSAPGRPASMPR